MSLATRIADLERRLGEAIPTEYVLITDDDQGNIFRNGQPITQAEVEKIQFAYQVNPGSGAPKPRPYLSKSFRHKARY